MHVGLVQKLLDDWRSDLATLLHISTFTLTGSILLLGELQLQYTEATLPHTRYSGFAHYTPYADNKALANEKDQVTKTAAHFASCKRPIC